MAPPTVRILSRYLLRQQLAPLAFALAALTAFMLINQVAKQFGHLVGKGLPWSVIAEVFVLSVPFIVAMTLPMAVLVAVLHAFTRLAADNEITAMQAGGVSVGRMLAPVLGGAALVTVLAFFWSDQLLPRSNHRLRTLLVDIQRKRPSLTLKEQVINEVVAGQFFLRAARIDQASNKLRDVTIYDLEDAERRRIITADSGRMAYTPGGRDLHLTLLDGDIQEVKRADPTQFNRTFFRVNRIRVAGIGDSLRRTEHDTYRSDREMTICAMERMVHQLEREAERTRRAARVVVANDLRRLAGLAPIVQPVALTADSSPADTAATSLYCRALGTLAAWLGPAEARAQTPAAGATPVVLTAGAGIGDEHEALSTRRRAAQYAVEIHKKYAIAAACLVFALVGVPVALRFPRGGVGLVMVMSTLVFTVYYIGLIAGEELGDRLIVSPFLVMWMPNLLFTVLGLLGLRLVRRAGSPASGGDWSDLRDALVGWIRRPAGARSS